MNEIKQLWERKHEAQGRIDITVFFVNIFLFLSHVLLMIIYLIIGNKVMICANIVSLLVYSLYSLSCYKNIERYMGIAFLEIWLHMIIGIISFGWTPCYQNWCFGIIAAYFLPAFSPNNNKSVKRPFYFALIVMLSYFLLATLPPLFNISFKTELNIYLNSVLFIINNTITFTSIILFILFYTSRSNRKEIELSRKADYDELTNLYNRYALNQIGEKVSIASQNNNKNYSVAIIDIDFFKKVNDKYGHLSGDMVLKEIANQLRISSVRGMIPGRWGGEEFIIISPYNVTYNSFCNALEKLRQRVEEKKFTIENDKQINLTISIGSTHIKGNVSLEEAVSKADENLYKAKELGRNKLIK